MIKKNLQFVTALFFVLSLITSNLNGQISTNVEALQQFAAEKELEFATQQQRVAAFAEANNIIIWQELEDGTVIQLMDVVDGQPVFNITHNLGAAITTRADQLWEGGSTGLELSGAGYDKLGEWDGGATRTTHQEFNDQGYPRVIQADNATSFSSHATHVAGTLVGGGVNIEAKGMAYGGLLKAYDWNNAEAEMAAAAAEGMEISNHSYGWITGWHYSNGSWSWTGNSSISPVEDYRFGFYGGRSRDWDIIAYNAPNYLITKSAGNDRGDGPSYAGQPGYPEKDGGDDGFDCIGDGGISKNTLTVGAVQEVLNYTGPGSVVMSGFSSWGPADDGRIKPDVVGKGVNLYSPTAGSNTAYSTYSGTSMSSPNVAGTMALLQQHYQNTHDGIPMRSSTLKALVIHTADEAGPHTGPDYMFGWGLVNAERAANMISEDNVMQNVMDEITLNDGEAYERVVTASGNQPFRVTVVWTDPAGTPPSPGLNQRIPALVNDLDLRIEDEDGNVFYPYQLDPDNPTAPPTADTKNFVDNVEQVFIANPEAGDYTIIVDHEGPLTNDLQVFSIIISGIDEHTGVPFCSNGLISPADGTDGHSVVQEIKWAPAPFASSYDVYFGTDGEGIEPPTNILNGLNVGSNYVEVDQLDLNETYYLMVVPRNNQGANDECSEIWSFGTMPAIEVYPYVMDVEDVPAQSIPQYWEGIDANQSARWRTIINESNSGSRSLLCVNNSNIIPTNFDNWVVSQPFKVEAANEYIVSFYYRTVIAGTSENLSLYWGTQPSADDLTNPIIHLSDIEATEWTYAEVLIVPNTDEYLYLGWHAYSENGLGVFIDDIKVRNWGIVSASEMDESSIRVYSADGDIYLTADRLIDEGRIEIHNAQGQLMHTNDMKNTQQYRAGLNLPSGVYLVSFSSEGKLSSQKVLVR